MGMKSADVVKIVVCLLGGVATALYSFYFGTSSKLLLTITLISLLAFFYGAINIKLHHLLEEADA